MTAYTHYDNMERINKLETTVGHLRETNSVHRTQIATLLSEGQKQQAEVKRLNDVVTEMGEKSASLFGLLTDAINEISAGQKDGL